MIKVVAFKKALYIQIDAFESDHFSMKTINGFMFDALKNHTQSNLTITNKIAMLYISIICIQIIRLMVSAFIQTVATAAIIC